MKTTKTTNDHKNVLINCPSCENWEEQPIDRQRHKLQNFDVIEWKEDTEGKNEISKMQCNECKEIFLLEWAYTEEVEKYARKCDITGKGMNEGYCYGDGEIYFSEKEYLVKHLREINTDLENNLTDEYILTEAYENEEYYFTTWEDIEEGENYFDADGNEYTAEGKKVEAEEEALTMEEIKEAIEELIKAINSNVEELWNPDLKQANNSVKIQHIIEETEKLKNIKNKLKNLKNKIK